MINRIIGVLTLNVNVIEEIEHDENATMEAAMIVAAVAIVGAIGAFLGAQFGGAGLEEFSQQFGGDVPIDIPIPSPIGAAVSTFIGTFVTWVLWSALTYLIGTNMFNGQATMGEMLRVIGYAQAPRILGLFAFIPCLGALLGLVGGIWSLVAGFVAIRQGLDLDNTNTAITVVISFIIAIVVQLCVLTPIFAFMM
ncbi:MAG: Yip1 family protein [Chloroflexota bacterium]